MGIDKIDGGILLDLGASYHQLTKQERGFSFSKDAPLDMRFNQDSDFSAYDVINSYKEEDLVRIFSEYGEERFSKRIARKIVEVRQINPIATTVELANLIVNSTPKINSKIHPATRVFQAIRIEVNQELKVLENVLPDAIDLLNNGGRISVITFHSLEDRIVKQTFKKYSEIDDLVKGLPVIPDEYKPKIKLINKKPILPSEEECIENSRSKSSKLRIIERV